MHLLPVAPPHGTTEVDTLDSSKEALCRGLKDGFSAAWDALAPEGLAREYPGAVIAAQLFDAEDIAAYDSAWQRFSALFAPLLHGEVPVERLGREESGDQQQQPSQAAA